MLSNTEPLVVRANAGTGKTFALSNRFIALLAAGEKPERILATTFTRKAAAEIQARIFTRLADASTSEAAAAKLSKELGGVSIGRGKALELLNALVADQHRLSICTLDSLCVRLMQMFALEVGFAQGIKISSEEQDRELTITAVSGVLKGQETENLYTLLRSIGQGTDRQSVQARLEKLLSGCFQLFLTSNRDAWHAIEEPEILPKERVAAYLTELAALPPVMKKDGKEPNSNFVKGLSGDLGKAQREDWENFLSGGMAAKIFAGSTEYNRVQIPDLHLAIYAHLVKHASACVVRALLQRTQAIYRLLSDFNREYWSERDVAGALTFGDVKQRLAEGSILGSLDDIYFRLDSRFAHLLLDEFQDTSITEWKLIEPIASEVISKAQGIETTFFCVGDVKQAIYGWRGGVAQIFDTITSRWPHVRPERLEYSYRSSPEIVQFVNKVCSSFEKSSVLGEFPAVTATWNEHFAPHKSAMSELKGFVELQLVAADGGDAAEVEASLTAKAVELVADLHKRNPSLSIGVLVARNRDVRLMVRALSAPAVGISASEEGGNPLTDSKAVLAFLALFLLVDHPGDTISQFHVSHSPLGKVLGTIDWTQQSSVVDAVSKLRAEILSNGIGKKVLALLHETEGEWSTHDRKRVLQLADLGFAFDERRSVRMREFVRFVELKKVEKSHPSPIRVMTYHKSKGLEFDVVVLPYLNGELLRKGAGGVLWSYRSNPTEPPEKIISSVKAALRGVHPAFEEIYRQQREGRVLEALNVLYVALTRPRYALYGLLPAIDPDEKGATKLTYANILTETLGLVAGEASFQEGHKDWLRSVALLSPIASEALPTIEKVNLRPHGKIIRSSTFLAPSSMEGEGAALVGSVLDSSRDSQIQGVIFHKFFEAISWVDDTDVEIPFDRILSLQRVPEAEWAKYKAEFERMLKAEPINRLLTEGAYLSAGCSVELFRELPFTAQEGEELIRGVMDRVVVVRKGERVEMVHVIDFKTDRVGSADLDSRVSYYTPQLTIYVDAAMRIFEVPATKVKAQIAFARMGKVVDL